MKARLFLLPLVFFSWASFSTVAYANDSDPCAGFGTSVLVDGDGNELFLCEDDRSVANHSVAFGRNGLYKRKRGDGKTPVGTFRLAQPRRSNSGYHTFIGIQVPPKMGIAVGIHGPHRWGRLLGPFHSMIDWTAGCIATWSDAAIQEIASFVKRHRRIKIHVLPDLATASGILRHTKTQLETGDLIFQTSKTKVAATVIGGTGSTLTHVGMVVMRREEPWVIEAIGPVKYTRLDDFVSRGVGDYFVIKRMKDGLTSSQKRQVRRAAETFRGRPYDRWFRWDNRRIYCSELVFKAYRKGPKITVGRLERFADIYQAWNPFTHVYKRKVYGKRPLPTRELIITPQSMHDSEALATVINTYPR